MAPFVVTLAMLFVARGLGLWITKPGSQICGHFSAVATARVLGVPSPVLSAAADLVAAQMLATAGGPGCSGPANWYRHRAQNPAAAEEAGICVRWRLCALRPSRECVTGDRRNDHLAQLGRRLAPIWGRVRRALTVIRGRSPGGASLFGGRGTAWGLLGAAFGGNRRNA